MDIEITINGKKVMTKTGLTILEAASQAGIRIPVLCYLRRLRPIGSCRICSVEVKGIKHPLPSCVARVKEGYEISTDTDKVWEVRKGSLSHLLLDHPLDCPVCDKSGDCLLQDLSFEFGLTVQKNKKLYPDRTQIFKSDFIEYNATRCVLCSRCIRVCSDMYGNPFLEIKDKGYNGYIGLTQENKTEKGAVPQGSAFVEIKDKDDKNYLDCYYCGNCIEVCPVGALVSKQSKFKERYWQESPFSSVCNKCSAACRVEYYRYAKDESLVRTAAAFGGYLCRSGFFYDAIGKNLKDDDYYIKNALVRIKSDFSNSGYTDALNHLADRLKNIIQNNEMDRTAVIVSSSVSTNDGYLISNFVKDVLKPAGFDIDKTSFYRKNYLKFKEIFKSEENFEINAVQNSDFVLYIGSIEDEIPYASYNIMKSHREHGGRLILIDVSDANAKKRSENFARFEDIASIKIDINKDYDGDLHKYLNELRQNLYDFNFKKTDESVDAILKNNTISIILGDNFMSLADRDKELLILKEITGFSRDEQKIVYVFPLIKPFNYRGLIAAGINNKAQYLSYENIISGIETGQIKNLIYIGDYEEPEHNVRGLKLSRYITDLNFVAALSSKISSITAMADIVLPVQDFLEHKDGYFENFEGKTIHVSNEFNLGEYRYGIAEILDDLSDKLGISFNTGNISAQFLEMIKANKIIHFNKIKPKSKFYYNDPSKLFY
jgi:NADH dehydrogenase/NADH:ubiquinone oxidoreductase subunit G